MDDDRFIIVRYYGSAMEANFARAWLESHGMSVFLKDEHTIGTNPMFSVLLGGIKLQVPLRDRQQALSLLHEMERSPSTDEDGHAITCPKCGSSDVQGGYSTVRSWRGLFSMLIAWFTGTLPLNTDTVFRCDQCGARFVPPPGPGA